ncbi:collagen-like triple helix repeat-containing protein [Glaciimonas soli]|uniref:Uncharacterized protein n=1 Tax=Glaciimonas soli TaxID=2590999 RepID=A0A843YTW2_9BURK|nr:collagen-like protein [Glaciimonas soli]MQR00692.1 hypothetical protein [Glaciimonas soli]
MKSLSNNPEETIWQITEGDIPTWYVADTVSLPQYLAKNPYRSVIRIFAREVILVDDTSWQAALGVSPIDLRIDCETIKIVGHVTVNFSGTDTALGWKSKISKVGDEGFTGGAISINAVRIDFDDNSSKLSVMANGGAGGNGAEGMFGFPGADIPPLQPGHPPLSGGPGGHGGDGGNGGKGGNGGSISIAVSSAEYKLGLEKQLLVQALGGTAGEGGKGGTLGKGGKGSPATSRFPCGEDGPDGIPGNPGAVGSSGNDGNAKVESLSFGALANCMLNDQVPNGLEIRMHRMITAAVLSSLKGSSNSLNTKLKWLQDLAAPSALNLPTVTTRIEETLASQKQYDSTPPRYQRKVSVSAAITLLQSLANIGNDDYQKINQLKAAIFNSSMKQGVTRQNDLNEIRQTLSSSIVDPKEVYKSGFSVRMQLAAKSLASQSKLNGIADIELDDLFKLMDKEYGIGADGMDADAGFLFGDVLGEFDSLMATSISEMALGLEGIAIIGGLAAFTIITVAFQMSLWGHNNAEEIAYQKALEQWVRDTKKWQLEEAKEKLTYQAIVEQNKAQGARELQLSLARSRQKAKEDTKTIVRNDFGRRYIGVLDSLDPVEDKPGNFIAVFDCLLCPLMTDTASLSAFIANAFLGFSFVITIPLTDNEIKGIVPGEWHKLEAKTIGSGTSSIDTYISGSNIGAGTTIGTVFELPARIAAEFLTPTLEPVIGPLLDQLFQNIPVPVKQNDPIPKLRIPNVTIPSIDTVIVRNIGQGACHSLNATVGGNSKVFFWHDIGFGSPADSASMTILVGEIVKSEAAICLSHWDRDHYRLSTLALGRLLTSNTFLSPSYGIKGPTVERIVSAILLAGKNKGIPSLYLGGPTIPAFAQNSIGAWKGVDFAAVTVVAAALIPNNVVLSASTKSESSWDKNNNYSVAATISGANGFKILLPGDCSYSYIPIQQKANLSHLEATHHGSKWSLLKSSGAGVGTISDNDIPPTKAGQPAVLVLSNGKGNSYGHSAALIKPYYDPKNWNKSILETSTLQANISLDVTFPQLEILTMDDV